MEVKIEVLLVGQGLCKSDQGRANSLRSWKFLDEPSGKAERKWTLPYAISCSIVQHIVLNSLFHSQFHSLL